MTAKKNKTETASTEPLPFEQALSRLEEVVDAMEDGELSLDEMIAHFEEGTKLARHCEEKLRNIRSVPN